MSPSTLHCGNTVRSRCHRRRISHALAQFLRALISYRTKFDRGFTAVYPPADNVLTLESTRSRGSPSSCGIITGRDQISRVGST